jgi:hypothetical protein
MDPPSHSTARRHWAGWLLVAYLVPLSALVLTVRLSGTGLPQLADALALLSNDLAVVPGLRFGHIEAAANVLAFVPLGFLLAALLGRRAGPTSGWPDWSIWLSVTALSAGIELIQLFLLTERSATWRDLVCNSAGALAGVLLFRIIQVARHRASRRNRP